jgi:hypothetical protein
MTSSNSNFPVGSANGVAPPSVRQARLELDNLLRRELRVSDPSDAKAVASALAERYKNNPRAKAIQSEALGLPFSTATVLPAAAVVVNATSDGEYSQANDDVERNLQELLTNSLLNSVLPEIRGWAAAIRGLIQEGSNSARVALDVNQRDKTFGIRRNLGDYARMARLVGAATPAVNMNYRKLAQSLDAVAAVLLVKMGEVLANGSFNGGRFIMQAPYSELQARRDAVINALRNLVGSTQQALGPNDWPRGIEAYGELYTNLENQGQSDLRALLEENELARIMDSLIQRAARGEADGMRALGSTAQLDLQRFRRLVIVAQGLVDPESPPLTSFLVALNLFADAFTPSGGIRLLRVARPAILFYGLYGANGDDSQKFDQNLSSIILYRGQLANRLDCRASSCGSDGNYLGLTILLDKVLYDVDRSIDLYALGNTGFGLPERRASAYCYLIEQVLNAINATNTAFTPSWIDNDLQLILSKLSGFLAPQIGVGDDRDFVAAATAANLYAKVTVNTVLNLSAFFKGNSSDYSSLRKRSSNKTSPLNSDELTRLENYRTIDRYLSPIHQELCMQLSLEDQWQRLLQSMAPNCSTSTGLTLVQDILKRATKDVKGGDCEESHLHIPPQLETLLDQFVNNISTKGMGRGRTF